MKKIVVSGYYGFGNSGDEAILSTVIRDLRELDPNIQITVLSIKPSETKKNHGVFAINRYDLIKVYRYIKKCDLLVFGGGSLIQDISSTRSLLYYLLILRIGIFLNKKIILYANGIGPVNSLKNRQRAKKVLNKADTITLRESDSLELLNEIGVNKPNIIITADPVLTYKQVNSKKLELIFDKEDIPINSQVFGVNLREWSVIGNLEAEIVHTINNINERYDLLPVFIPMSQADRNISERVRKKLKCKSYMLKEDYLPDALIAITGKMKFVIAMRLHTLIYASINSIPMIGLVYDPKIKGYMDYISQASAGDVDRVKANNLLELVDDIMDNYDLKKVKLQSIIDKLKLESKRNAKIAIDLIKNKQ